MAFKPQSYISLTDLSSSQMAITTYHPFPMETIYYCSLLSIPQIQENSVLPFILKYGNKYNYTIHVAGPDDIISQCEEASARQTHGPLANQDYLDFILMVQDRGPIGGD